MMTCFDNWFRVAGLPAPIAEAVQEMLDEIQASGEHTTADETANAIEASLAHLGRLWVAEYLAAGAPDPGLNADLLAGLGRRDPSVGQWVGLSRRLRAACLDAGYVTIVPGLADLDFGDFGDADHPIARLVAYRNSFGHGSLQAVVDDIHAHRELLAQVLERLPALWDHPILVASPETGGIYQATGTWADGGDLAATASSTIRLSPGHPAILGAGRDRLLELYPLYHLVESAAGPALAHGSANGKSTVPIQDLFQRQVLATWYARYEYERAGHLGDDPALLALPGEPLPAGMADQLQAALADATRPLISLRGHPGSGKAQALRALLPGADLATVTQPFAAMAVIACRPGELSQSGVAVGNRILRLIEGVLGHQDGHYGHCGDGDLNRLDTAKQDLERADKRVLLLIDDLHHGALAYRGEPVRVLDVHRRLAGRGVTCVATLWPGSISEPVFTDRIIDWPIPDELAVTPLIAAVNHCCKGEEDALRRQVLRIVSRSAAPMDCFAVCAAIDAESGDGAHPIFEPRVERALYALRPLLREGRSGEGVRIWQPLTPAMGTIEAVSQLLTSDRSRQ